MMDSADREPLDRLPLVQVAAAGVAPRRTVREARAQEPGLSVNAACKQISPQLRTLPD